MSRQGGMEAGTFAKELYSLESSKETKGKIYSLQNSNALQNNKFSQTFTS